MTSKICKQVSRNIILGMSLAAAAVFAEETRPVSENAADQDQLVLQRVVVPPPPGPYASRMGMPNHTKRFERMMNSINRGMPPPPFPSRPAPADGIQQNNTTAAPVYPPQTDSSAPSWGQENQGTYRSDEPDSATVTTPAAPAYGYPRWGYAPGYRPGPPRGYGYPPVPPPAYGYHPAPPPGYGSHWNVPQPQAGAAASEAPQTGQPANQ